MTKLGIDASRAFLHERTGIEEYSYQVIKNLRGPLGDKQVILYLRKGTKDNIDFDLPEKWRVKELWLPRLWTYLRLSFELFVHPVEKLFVPGHIVPILRPKDTTVVIHGLEYEFTPEAYSWWERFSMRCGIKNSCQWAKKIITVSDNTMKDLIELYHIPQDKITRIYEGVNESKVHQVESLSSRKLKKDQGKKILANNDLKPKAYLIFIGRLEERKNIVNVVRAFTVLKEKHQIPHKLVLVGKGGYGYEKIEQEIAKNSFKDDIIAPGFVSDEEKWVLLQNASIFLFPTLYEGFGLPILEAQSMDVPVVTADNSSLTEIGGDSVLFADEHDPADIAKKVKMLISDESLKHAIIEKGRKNLACFNWQRCANEIAEILLEK